jgi:hypothetical protein
MTTSQRISRGFHKLALFLAAIVLLLGVAWSATTAINAANSARQSHDEQLELVCAKTAITNHAFVAGPDGRIDLKTWGCSDEQEMVLYNDALNARAPDEFSYATELLPPLTLGLSITLALSLAVYLLVRAIGWVIGGFAAS